MASAPPVPAYKAPSLPPPSLAPMSLGGSTGGSSKPWEERWQQASDMIMKNEIKKEITVLNPTVMGSSIVTKYVSYEVATSPLEYSVQRRYTDFIWLRDRIVLKYPGLLVPSLPPKKSATGIHRDVESEFIRTRMSHLNIFMRHLSSIPFVVGDSAFESFLTKAAGAEWDAARKDVESGADQSHSTGQTEWGVVLDNCNAPEDDLTVERISIEVKTHLSILLSNLYEIEKNWNSCSTGIERSSKELSTLVGSVGQWRDFEHNLSEPAGGVANIISSLGPEIKLAITNFSDGVTQWNTQGSQLSTSINDDLLAVVQFQIMLAEGLQMLMNSRDDMLQDINKAEKELAQLRLDADRLATAGVSMFDKMQGKSTDKIQGTIVRREARLTQLRDAVKRVGRALWYCEVDRFSKERTMGLFGVCKDLIKRNKVQAEENLKAWKSLDEQF